MIRHHSRVVGYSPLAIGRHSLIDCCHPLVVGCIELDNGYHPLINRRHLHVYGFYPPVICCHNFEVEGMSIFFCKWFS